MTARFTVVVDKPETINAYGPFPTFDDAIAARETIEAALARDGDGARSVVYVCELNAPESLEASA